MRSPDSAPPATLLALELQSYRNETRTQTQLVCGEVSLPLIVYVQIQAEVKIGLGGLRKEIREYITLEHEAF